MYSAFHCAFRDVIRQLKIFFAIGLNERLCSRERFLCISEAGKMLINEGVYLAERRFPAKSQGYRLEGLAMVVLIVNATATTLEPE